MEAARVKACRARWARGAHKGAIEAKNFSLPNPGGGVDLVEDAAFTLVRGRRYALVGRNGKGKSTLLQAVAARRVGSVPEACAVHYVHQDIQLSKEQEELRPVDLVLAADVERREELEQRLGGRRDVLLRRRRVVELVHHVERDLLNRNKHHLRDPLTGLNLVGLAAPIPDRHKHLALVIRIEQGAAAQSADEEPREPARLLVVVGGAMLVA